MALGNLAKSNVMVIGKKSTTNNNVLFGNERITIKTTTGTYQQYWPPVKIFSQQIIQT